MTTYYIGTSGWSYRHWVGPFYPNDLKPPQFLEYYMRYFPTVEINSTFYHLPKPATVENWFKRSPAHFRFCPKLSRWITHQKKLVGVEEALERFFELIQVLKPKLGPVLIQLPPSLKFDSSLLENFLNLLRRHYSDYQFAIEPRHSSWDAPECRQILSDFQVALVCAHSGKRFPYFNYQTAPFVYYRFHGPDRLYASDYPPEMLREFADRMCQQARAGATVWAFFNNDYQGFAVRNARQLMEWLEAE